VGAAGPAALAEAVEMLARQLLERPERVNASAQRTLAQAVARLRSLEFAPRCPWQPGPALVVDDDPIALRLACEALAKVHIPVISATDPAEALAQLQGQRFAVVVTDVMMDGMSGLQLAARIRQHPEHSERFKNSRVPVIYVTAIADFARCVATDDASGNDVIAKPYLLLELAVKALVHQLR
jgi:CheY-like chemotaxis protein